MEIIGAHKTSVFTDDDNFTKVIYHSTCVVSFNRNIIVLNTGGWYSCTTKKRMNQASEQFNLGYRVTKRKGIWYALYKGQELEFLSDKLILDRVNV